MHMFTHVHQRVIVISSDRALHAVLKGLGIHHISAIRGAERVKEGRALAGRVRPSRTACRAYL